MPINNPHTLSDTSIDLINSLGGPPLPTGVSTTTLKVIMENQAASHVPPSSCRIATSLASRRHH